MIDTPKPSLHLTFSADHVECDASARTISGRIVPFGEEIGLTSVGPLKFESGSIQYAEASEVLFRMEHDKKQPIGRAVDITQDANAMYGTFRVAATTRGNDALVEASEGLRGGLSLSLIHI